MKRSQFISTALAALFAPFAAKAAAKVGVPTSTAPAVPAPEAAKSVPTWPGQRVELRCSLMGYRPDDATRQGQRQVWTHLRSGGLAHAHVDEIPPALYTVSANSAEELLQRVLVNAAVTIAHAEHPNDLDAVAARFKELAGKVRIG